jgi:hypothetical protein
MAGGYILPNGDFLEDTSSTTEPAPLPVDSVCGAAEAAQQPTTDEVTE